MQKVIHLIPYDGIGGVESAARSMAHVSASDLDFRVEALFSPLAARQRWGTFNPISFLLILFRLWRAAPDLVVVSLWRSCLIGVFLKLLNPHLRLILFLHFPSDVHGIDRFITRLSARLSSRVWADSNETLERRLPGVAATKGRVISFVTESVVSQPRQPVRAHFIFWGRIHAQKGLKRALYIFAGVKKQSPDARFWMIGPDGGDLPRVRSLIDSLGLTASVQLLGGMNFYQIRSVAESASFYLQTSELEGMAMSVVEAMQLGLLPVVTPVGEVKHYAKHGKNALVVTDNATTISDIVALLEDDVRYQAMCKCAVATWEHQPLYRDSVLDGCREALGLDNMMKAV